MEVIVGKTAGFCFGVKRAVDKAYELTEKYQDKSIYCLGELVHNRIVIESLQNRGIKTVNKIDEIQEDGAIVIIRAHGVIPDIYEQAKTKNLEVVDCTCPFVKRIHDIVSSHSKNGDFVFVIGDKNHPEVIGTRGYCNTNCFIINEKKDVTSAVDNLLKSNCKNLLIVAQTTFNGMLFEEIVAEIKSIVGSRINIAVEKTICDATNQRQTETLEIARQVDFMIIVGGKNSSNTRKLFDISNKITKTILIETSDEIDINSLQNYSKIGIMAGASTPQETIQEVKKLFIE